MAQAWLYFYLSCSPRDTVPLFTFNDIDDIDAKSAIFSNWTNVTGLCRCCFPMLLYIIYFQVQGKQPRHRRQNRCTCLTEESTKYQLNIIQDLFTVCSILRLCKCALPPPITSSYRECSLKADKLDNGFLLFVTRLTCRQQLLVLSGLIVRSAIPR